jgi:type VI secretion system secreted protein VgrG
MDKFEGARRITLSLNKYIYANADPVNNIDPSGYSMLSGIMSFSMPMITFSVSRVGIIMAVRVISATIAIIYISYELYLAVAEEEFSGPIYALTPEQAAQKQAEYEIMRDLSRMPPDPRNDCSGLAARIHHALAVLNRYKAWDAKWFPGRHTEKIQDWENRLENLKKEHNKKCAK